jgi:hypothetical protein
MKTGYAEGIEVKGSDPLNPMPVSAAWTWKVLQRMDDPGCKYSVALPDVDHLNWRGALMAGTEPGLLHYL